MTGSVRMKKTMPFWPHTRSSGIQLISMETTLIIFLLESRKGSLWKQPDGIPTKRLYNCVVKYKAGE